jgi:hypothetical protein
MAGRGRIRVVVLDTGGGGAEGAGRDVDEAEGFLVVVVTG